MDSYQVLPDKAFGGTGPVAEQFRRLGITRFHEACRFVHELPYGYNSDRDDLMILFKEKMGSCTTKHAVITTLAQEIGLPIEKNVGIYAMTEDIASGTKAILAEFNLPYVPMLHCFLVCGERRVDLTEGNRNGKKRPIENFLYTAPVEANIAARDEYLLYRKALADIVLRREELSGADMRRVLQAREQALKVLKENIDKDR